MGTLFNQSERKFRSIRIRNPRFYNNLEDQFFNLDDSAKIEFLKVLEYERRTDIMVDDGDAKDEQLAGFGELFQSFNEKLENISNLPDNSLKLISNLIEQKVNQILSSENLDIENLIKKKQLISYHLKNEYMTQTQAYKYLGISERKIIELRNEGILPYLRKGRKIYYKVSEIENYEKENNL